MARTYHQIYVQAIFAPKYRSAVLRKELQPEIFGVIGNLISETGCKTIIVNGVEDHVHCFLGLKPTVSVSQVMKVAKAKSSKHINDNGLMPERFEWQEGYGAFSYSHADMDQVYHYITRQEEHHTIQSFKAEYLQMLTDHDIPFEERHIFHELI